MKRRTFLTALSALVAAPALPARAAAPVSVAATKHFATAKMLAQCHDRASPEMFMRLMKLDAETAQGVFRLLQNQNVIAKGFDGVARAVSPLNTHCIPNEAVRARTLMQGTVDLKKRLQKFAKRKWDEMDDPKDTAEPTT
jgi:hypothetical protein